MSVTPIAVLGPGGVGGVIAARTGAVCVGTERTVGAIEAGGLVLVHDGTRNPDDLARVAGEAGFAFTAEEYQAAVKEELARRYAAAEIGEEQLHRVAGGADGVTKPPNRVDGGDVVFACR